jgi:hypothetical protein
MKSSLRSRLAKLEVHSRAAATPSRFGCVLKLPRDFVGERHVVLISRERIDFSNEKCVYREMPGPGANEAEGASVYHLFPGEEDL